MPRIIRPMLAETYDLNLQRWPAFCTPKVDGIRFTSSENGIMSRSMKPLPNVHLQSHLSELLIPGFDGELFYHSMQATDSIVMAKDNKQIKKLTIYIFDFVEVDCPVRPYKQRIGMARSWVRKNLVNRPEFQVLYPKVVRNHAELVALNEQYAEQGFEGIMLRDPMGGYKNGRCGQTDQWLVKFKTFLDAEATIIGFNCLQRNDNAQFTAETGQQKRSHRADGKTDVESLGAFVVRNSSGQEFSIGSGFTDEQRLKFWANQQDLLGRLVKFKYQPHGTKEAPRSPVFLGIRNLFDVSELEAETVTFEAEE